MNFRGAGFSTSSRSTSQTLCQKCLKRGHYSYECRASTQERPYTSRPSRTKLLANPSLTPKLTSDIANKLDRKQGVADEELAKRAEERGRTRKTDLDARMTGYTPHSRSNSSLSGSSSTDLSPSSSPGVARRAHTGQSQFLANLDTNKRRRRSPSTSMSYTSESPSERKRKHSHEKDDVSPGKVYSNGLVEKEVAEIDQLDNRRHRKIDPHLERRKRSRSSSSDPDKLANRRLERSLVSQARSKRRRHSSKSPEDRGRERDTYRIRGSRRTRSPSESRDRSQVTRTRKSMTPSFTPHQREQSWKDMNCHPQDCKRQKSRNIDKYHRTSRYSTSTSKKDRTPKSSNEGKIGGPAAVAKERSLSPFSKRLALTQAMNAARQT